MKTKTSDCMKLTVPMLKEIGIPIRTEVIEGVECFFIQLKYKWNGQNTVQKIYLTTTTPNYGGKRWWFVCPHSGERCAVLYLMPHSWRFASQKALNLAYPCQNESYYDRFVRKHMKYRGKLNIEPFTDTFKRPKGMHRSTHQRHIDMLWSFREQADAIYLSMR